MQNKLFIFIILGLVLTISGHAQSVGLVLSGGGAKGLSHIGTLKALEEHNIPIDYITGTSMGGIVGAMYAAGYSPTQIEKIALTESFQQWVNGRYQSDYLHYFQKGDVNASMISSKVNIDTGFHVNMRSTLVNDIPLNFALIEIFAQASAAAKGNFNKLMIPYRCMVADILSQKSITVKKGNLAEAVRATMTVPIIFRPIKLDGQYVFDGGLYNNFPVDVMKNDFNPDYVIGANVSSKVYNEYPAGEDERLISKYITYLFLSKSDSTLIGKNGIYLQPDLTEFSVSNFGPVAALIKRGYDATIADIEKIKASVKRRVTAEELRDKRSSFNQSKPDLYFDKVNIYGVNTAQKKYIERLFVKKDGHYNMPDIKRAYYKLVADQTFETIYPRVVYDSLNRSYNFEIIAQPKKNLKVELGGNIASRPISNVYLGMEYSFLNNKAYTLGANFYSGKFYESIQGFARIDFPTRLPIYVNASFTYNHWNYYNTSKIFIENPNPTFIEQSDRKLDLSLGIPLNNNTKASIHVGIIENLDKYSPNNSFNIGDILDQTNFEAFRGSFILEKNSLNRKQYATRGHQFALSADFIIGKERYSPGNILRHIGAPIPAENSQNHKWFKLKLQQENYFFNAHKITLGYQIEGVYSNQDFFSNYYSTLLYAPTFYPLQDSRSLFIKNFRASTYAAGGLKMIYGLWKNIDLRGEGYIFLPHKAYTQTGIQDVTSAKAISKIIYATTAGFVYHSPFGPVSLSYNTYRDPIKRNGVFLHIGYLIYNKRSLE